MGFIVAKKFCRLLNIKPLVIYFRSWVKIFLDKPNRKWLLGLIASFYSIRKGKFSYIFFHKGVWVHKYRDQIIVDRHINYNASLENYEKEAKDNWLFIYKPKPGHIIFDIGSGRGGDAYCFSKLVAPHGRVIAIEAHPQTFLCLSEFCKYNNLKNIMPLNLAICEKESEVIIDNPNMHVSSTIINSENGFKVRGMPLDLIVETFEIDKIDFIKMNIEGAEKRAIHGMTNCIKKTRYVCIACHDFVADQNGIEQMRTKDEVLDFLRKNNFRITSRSGDSRPWIRHQLYGINEHLIQT